MWLKKVLCDVRYMAKQTVFVNTGSNTAEDTVYFVERLCK
jgi:hypothetical protein